MSFRLTFPKITNPANKRDYLALWMKPIKPARPDLDASHCHVVGIDADGRHHKFVIPLATWHRARMAPVVMVEDNTGAPAPSAGLVDAAGQLIPS